MAGNDDDIEWRDGATPVSRRFGDVYFDAADGLAETRHVFLGGCGLPGGWHGKPRYCIGETGFGTGLNFLAAWAAWRETATPDQRLDFVSVEAHPLAARDMARAHAAFPELSALSDALCAVWPERGRTHRLLLDGGRVALTVVFDEAARALEGLEARVDAWFLDGFAPAKNPDMWRPEVLAELVRLSAPGARLATFTAVGAVRRGLAEVGFAVEKAPGFGSKRDMTVGRFDARPVPTRLAPWHVVRPDRPRTVAVVGGGLAGTAVAEALTRRGVAVTVVERRDTLAAEASGNAMGLVMPRLSLEEGGAGAFFAAAYDHALRHYDRIGAPVDRCGVLHLARSDKERDRFARLAGPHADYLTAEEASAKAGVALDHPALWIQDGGWVSPAEVCRAQARDAEVRVGEDIDDLFGLLMRHEAVVVAGGLDTRAHEDLSWLPLRGQAGQVVVGRPGAASGRLTCVLAWGGYVTPVGPDGRQVLGTTHDRHDTATVAPTDAATARILANVDATVPGLTAGFAVDGARTGVRATTPDRLPIAGPAPDKDKWLAAFADLRRDARLTDFKPAANMPRLWLLSGLGARGLVTAPLAAELICSQMFSQPWPVARDVATLLHPGRFLIRALKRSEL